jgi:serine/threonine protein kinase
MEYLSRNNIIRRRIMSLTLTFSWLILLCFSCRELSLENILLSSSGQIKLIGIGDIAICQEPVSKSIFPYLAPEICDASSHSLSDSSAFTFATDVWSAGVVLYILLFQAFPFFSPDVPELFRSISSMRMTPMPLGSPEKSPDCMLMLNAMLTRSPDSRPSFADCVHFDWIQRFSSPEIELALTQESHCPLSALTEGDISTAITLGVAKKRFQLLSSLSFRGLPVSAVVDPPHDHTSPRDSEVVLVIRNHQWKRRYFNRPSWCSICGGFIVGLTLDQQNAYKCKQCHKYGHAACVFGFDHPCEDASSSVVTEVESQAT